jgi:hypothetical protein
MNEEHAQSVREISLDYNRFINSSSSMDLKKIQSCKHGPRIDPVRCTG